MTALSISATTVLSLAAGVGVLEALFAGVGGPCHAS